MISFRKFISLGGALSMLTVGFAGLTACSENPQNAGGVTDIGNSIAGIVVDSDGAAVPSARVVAYYDSWDQNKIADSVVAQANEQGEYSLTVKKDSKVVLFASSGEDCGLASTENVDQTTRNISIGKRRMYSSHIAGRNTGSMRVVGSTASTELDGDGYFIFYDMPPGDVTLAYEDSSTYNARVEFTTTGSKEIYVLPELVFVDGDASWLAVQDVRYYVGEGYDDIQIRNPKSEHWTTITELPETDSLPSALATVNVPQNVGSLVGFLFPIKIETKGFASDVNLSNIVVVNNDKWELFPSEIEYWNDTEALLWVRVAGVDSSVTELTFKVFESAEYAANLIPFDQGQKYDGVLSKIHFVGDAQVLNKNFSVAKSVADSTGLFGNGVTLNAGQFMSVDSVDLTYGDFTMSLWTKWEGANGNRQVLASERGDSTFKIQWRYDKGKIGLMHGAPNFMNFAELVDESEIPVGEWVHLVLTCKMGSYAMYVNGELVGEAPMFASAYAGAKMIPVRVGGSGVDADTWNGALDEIRIESVVRDAKWIKAVYEQQKSAAK